MLLRGFISVLIARRSPRAGHTHDPCPKSDDMGLCTTFVTKCLAVLHFSAESIFDEEPYGHCNNEVYK